MVCRMGYRTLWIMSILLGAGLSSVAHGHALEPGYLELRQVDESLYAVVWKKPAIEGVPMAIAVRLPEQCDLRMEGQLTWDGSAFYSRWTTTCAGACCLTNGSCVQTTAMFCNGQGGQFLGSSVT